MTNDEIRVKIAKLRGANWWEIDGQAYLCNPMHAAMLPKGAKVVDSPSPVSKVYYRVSNWPVDIKAAWELVEEMATPDNFGLSFWNNNVWECIYRKEEDYTGFVEADTAPLAICHAFIQWKESQK